MPKIEMYHDPAGSGLRGTVTYDGDPARPHSVTLPTADGAVRAATPEEAKALEIAELAHLYVRRDVLCCQTVVVEALAACDDDVQEAIYEATTPDPTTMSRERLVEVIEENGGGAPEISEYTDEEGWIDEEGYEEALGDAARDHLYCEEIYEWWLVDPMLADDLRDAGHVVLDAYHCSWWGRGCTGQAIILDPTFWELAAKRCPKEE